MQKYRPDVDGLRALAVVPVVLFHAQVSGFSGGFVGVDVFFVISGYLITSIIYSEVSAGRFSILSFYERRIRRILPALFTVIAASLVVASFLLLPDEMEAFGRSVIATILFSSNILFWRESGYFDSDAESKPLLHTWSLAVEEQFYIAFPVALFLCFKFAPRLLPWAIAAAAAGSFLLALAAQQLWPDANFYLPFPRAWELLIGALLAMNLVPGIRSEGLRNGLTLGGAAAIALSVFFYDSKTPFPGASALLPTLGAASIIYAGMTGSSYVTALLSRREVVFIGLVSYSLYLWHWPVLVFSRMAAMRDLTGLETAVAISASFLLAVLSWHYVERPFRTRTAFASRPGIFSATFASMAAFMAVGVVIVASGGLPQRVPENARLIASAGAEATNFGKKYECAESPLLETHKYGPCRIGEPAAGEPTILIWGDSHAMALKPMFDALLKDAGLSGFLVSIPGCPPIFEIERNEYGIPCARMTERLARFVEAGEAKKIIIVGSWAGIFTDKDTTLHGRTSHDDRTRYENIRAGLHLTFGRLKESGREIAFMMPTPGAREAVPSTLARSIVFGRNSNIEFSRKEYRKRLAGLESILATAPHPVDTVVTVEDYMCAQICDVARESQSLYFDSSHPSLYLNRLLKPVVQRQLESFMTGTQKLRAQHPTP
ncbi:MAG: acyltransferase family protein [Parvibaculum sp.]